MKRAILFINILIVTSMLLSACATPTPETIKEVVTQVVEVEKEVTRVVEGTPVVETVVETTVVEKEVTKIVEVEKVVTATPEEKPKKKLTWAFDMGTNCLDPAFQTGMPDHNNIMNIFSYLVAHKPGTLEDVNPDLAERWEVSDDGLVYTFYLRSGVKWQEGYGDFTAEDVKYSWERIMDPETKARGNTTLKVVESVEVVDPLTVRVTLKNPDPGFLIKLPHTPNTAIVNKRAVEERGEDHCLRPIGTGPYRVVWSEPSGGVIMVANDDYFGGRPVIDEVEMKVVPEESVAALALKAGEIDFVMLRGSAVIADLMQAGPDVVVNVDPSRSTSIFALHLNTSREPFDDVRVRYALIHALDRETLAREASEGMTDRPAHAIIAPSLFGHTDDVTQYEYDPEKAKALLAEAGYPDGIKITADSMTSGFYPVVLTMVQSYWKESGIDLEINFLDRAAMRQHQSEGNYDITVSDINRADPDLLLDFFRCDQFPPDGINRTFWNGPCELIEAQAREMDPEKRAEMLKTIQQEFAIGAPVVPLWHTPMVTAAGSYVTGLIPNLAWWQTRFYMFDIEK
jgi:peptide/nickel transport system substrate-binding protein